MSKVLVLGDVDTFRHIVASSLRACGVDATDAAIEGRFADRLTEERPDVVIIHPPQGVFEAAYLEQISRILSGTRVFVVRESSTVTASDDGAVSYVSRVQVRELVDTVRRLTYARDV